MTTQSTVTTKDNVRNTLMIALQRLGLPVGPIQMLTVPGRKSGQPRTTPVAPVLIDGTYYVTQAYPHADWVKNARAAGHGTLARGRSRQDVDLVELPEGERAAILGELPGQNPRGASAFVRNGLVEAPTREAFAAAAPRIPVFRVVPRTATPA